ncbi:serine proline-rich protein [Aspergillus piperis CBS 112811]|uniref:Serine proline-rich protein n=1 Tax=Aspergillus piperis CBS 112811 TaxID=1448313 RepID=A0A8G1RAW0_9EURO|nr:serine proline-rich protein [Aspergillus piperis CBS 112811]RAH62818.1 serine proline-rich protein [Aspergillus piperis CBS 112811]
MMDARVPKRGLMAMAHTAHAAGIFADMSVDGPIIGTLVVVADRAKNLPNRKTMGKQNPYCAARLGKEAKKTGTDLRGGQTPKWDDELRFNVHESPDYYRLKVSVFNDEKKTDLIGETWVDLSDLIIPGGSQNDHWHPLQYRGKYAGEVRLEMTYYDTRPEDEAVIERRTPASDKVHPRKIASFSSGPAAPSPGTLSGPRQLKDVKRRPLPSDPRPRSSAHSGTSSSSPVRANESTNPAPTLHHHSHSHHQDLRQPRVDNSSSGMSDSTTSLPTYNHREYASPQRLESNSMVVANSTGSYHTNPCPYPINPSDSGSGATHSTTSLPTYQNHEYARPHVEHSNPPMSDSSSLLPLLPNPHRVEYASQAPPHSSSNSLVGNATSSYNTSSCPSYHAEYTKIPDSSSFTSTNSSAQQPAYGHYREYAQIGYTPPLLTDSQPSSLSYAMMQPRVEDEEEDGLPPPPPAHRSGLVPSNQPVPVAPNPAPQAYTQPAPQTYMQPAPQAYTQPAPLPQVTMPEPMEKPASDNSLHTTPSWDPNWDYPRGRREETAVATTNAVPASLVPGFDPVVAAAESDRAAYEREVRRRSGNFDENPLQMVHQPVDNRRHSRGLYDENPLKKPVDTRSLVSRTSTAPNNQLVPRRKSVSPRPPSMRGREVSPVPFSPDSYLPEAAREPAARESGPIIGDDGREIDPSDHLPTNTWAPEPERKTKKPGVVVRFRSPVHRDSPPKDYGHRKSMSEAYSNSPSRLYAEANNPPIPSKVPVGLPTKSYGNIDQSYDALSRELNTIDIGGSGRGMKRYALSYVS